VIQRTGHRIARPHLLVLIARGAAAEASSEQLEKEWTWLMHRVSLIAAEPRPE
jgi:hypothetical protein